MRHDYFFTWISTTYLWQYFRSLAYDIEVDCWQGKVEMELHLVTSEEAEKSAVGLGREEPHPLSPPK